MKGHVIPRRGLRSNRGLTSLAVLAFVSILAISGRHAGAQTAFGSMVGNVTDASGGAIPTANVTIILTSTNDTRTVQTDAAGAYTVSTVTPGRYRVEVAKEGFRTFVASDILVNQNNVVRVDAQLQVGALAERVEVTTTAVAELQTERADVHAEIAADAFTELPQPNRTYEGLLALIPGTAPPAGQLAGGSNNPSKSMTFAFNGSGLIGGTVRIEGINATNLRDPRATSYVPSVEAIQNVNVATNATDAEQGQSGGATVNVMLKSGSNATHGAAYEYNIISAFEANNFFSATSKPPHLVDNNAGGFAGGHIIRNKLFYFGSYEGDFSHSTNSALASIPNATQLSGNMSGSANPIYDPITGTPSGTGRTPFPGNTIPISRFSPVSLKIIPNIPATNTGGPAAVVNDLYINQLNLYNLHKIETKLDYNATTKLRLSGRWGYQPYYNYQQPIYGPILGGSSSGTALNTAYGNGNYLQHGAGLAISVSGSYIIGPTFVVDATWGKISSHQQLLPTLSDQRYGLDVLGIPGTNQGPLPWAGGVPQFSIANFVIMGEAYPAMEYIQPLYEYVANATKIEGKHTIRFGADLSLQAPRHIEVPSNTFSFTGGITTVNGGPGANPYNALSDFLLGDFYEGANTRQFLQPYLTMRTYEFAAYVRDQWHVSPKLTVNYGVRWEKYPVPRKDASMNADLNTSASGIYFLNPDSATVAICGTGGLPADCGIHVSNKLFAPSIGIAYRPTEKFVVRAGYSLSPSQATMAFPQMRAFPGEVTLDMLGVNPYTPAGSLTTGLPPISVPAGTNGVYPIPPATGNLGGVMVSKDYDRGYFESYNFTVQKELAGGWLASVGYVGMHAVRLQALINLNYGTIGGGTASQRFASIPDYSAGITAPLPWGSDHYNSLQATLNRRLAQGLTIQAAYTYSKDIGRFTATGNSTAPDVAILVPQYMFMDRYKTSLDRTHHMVVTGTYEFPFGKAKAMARRGVGAAMLGGWTANGILNRYSGAPFTVTSSSASCNCPGNSQVADQVMPDVSVVGNGVGGQAYFDPLAYKPVTGARFGTSGFNQLRGPGNTNLDMSIFRTFTLNERFKFQIRAESMNISNTPHFGNPGANVSNLQLNSDGSVKNLNGFSQITVTNPLGRLLDQRYFRFGARVIF